MDYFHKLQGYCSSGFFGMLSSLENWLERVAEPFGRFMLKLSAIKLAVSAIVLLVMLAIFAFRLHVFDSITVQFSQWTSSSLIVFTLFLIMIKFVAVSVCLALFLLKKRTVDSLFLGFRVLKSMELSLLSGKKRISI